MRAYQPERDGDAIFRIHREVGWAEDEHREPFDLVVNASEALVEDVNGSPECLVLSVPGAIAYQDESLPFWGINGVSTSRVARKLGLAQRLTAESVARAADAGAAVVGLGMFEQGFYNQLGFGVGSYVHQVALDPANLLVDRSFGIPVRLDRENADEMHRARLARMHWHGMVDLHPAGLTSAECRFAKNGFGLGYRDDCGTLTHYFWAKAKSENGPYEIWWLAYRTWDQFLELLALLKSFGDQVNTLHLSEPAGIQMQDLISKPFKTARIRLKSDHAAGIRASAFWQIRICDLASCLAATHLAGPTLRFNLVLTDQIADKVDQREGWRGISGEYTITLGAESSATEGTTAHLPTLRATVSAFSRLWLGVQPASGLAVTDDLVGPPELLRTLDRLIRLPTPNMDWYF